MNIYVGSRVRIRKSWYFVCGMYIEGGYTRLILVGLEGAESGDFNPELVEEVYK